MTQPAEISFEKWSAVCWAVYSKWGVIAFFFFFFLVRKNVLSSTSSLICSRVKWMTRTYADGNVNMNYAFFFFFSSHTKGIVTLPILLRGFQFEEWSKCMLVCGKHLVCLIKSCTTVLVLGRKLLKVMGGKNKLQALMHGARNKKYYNEVYKPSFYTWLLRIKLWPVLTFKVLIRVHICLCKL